MRVKFSRTKDIKSEKKKAAKVAIITIFALAGLLFLSGTLAFCKTWVK
jgi:hypothetical protein